MVSHLHPDDLRALGARLLRLQPEASVRLRVLRDVLAFPEGDARQREAHDQVLESSHVERLASEQMSHGGWSRLHSRDASVKRAVPTTEWGVERALCLGLERTDEILLRASAYLADVVRGRRTPEDRPERNDRWETGVRLFAASTLAMIDADHEALDETWTRWHEIAERTFADGGYSEAREAGAHEELTGASVQDSYLVIGNRYAVQLLAARSDQVDRALQHALLDWLTTRPEGMQYLSVPLAVPGPDATSSQIERWLRSHEILSRFPVWAERATGVAEWLMNHRQADGLWDLGSRHSTSACLPLSSTWRKKGVRAIDWTTRILSLMAAMHRPSRTGTDTT